MSKIKLFLFYFLLIYNLKYYECCNTQKHDKLLWWSPSSFSSSFSSVGQHEDQRKMLTICNLCLCNRKYNSIDCFTRSSKMLRKNKFSIQKEIKINANYFDRYFTTKLKCLTIDFDLNDIQLAINANTFNSFTSLQTLILNNIGGIEEMPLLNESRNLKELTIQNSNIKLMSKNFCTNKIKLQKIELQYNDLVNIKNVFDKCKMLTLLDLSNNKITSLNEIFTINNKNLKYLVLDYNYIKRIDEFDLKYVPELIELSMSNNFIEYIDEKAFESLIYLKKLNFYKNNLHSLPSKSQIYNTLQHLDVSENANLIYFPSATLFKSIKELSLHYSYHCCQFENKKRLFENRNNNNNYKNNNNNNNDKEEVDGEKAVNENMVKVHKVLIAQPLEIKNTNNDENYGLFGSNDYDFVNSLNSTRMEQYHDVKCLPDPDAFTPCENLIDNWILRISAWFLAVFGIIPNSCAIIYNIQICTSDYNKNNYLVSNFLLLNLGIGDLMMNMYLLFIAYKDSTSIDNFGESAITWQISFTCSLAGFLCVISVLSTAFFLAFITFERFYVINNSFVNKRVSMRTVIPISILIWIVSLIAALLPLFNINSYSSYAICLPFDTRTDNSKFHMYLMTILLIMSFLFIFVCYMSILISTVLLKRRSSLSQTKMRHTEEQTLFRNISLLVLVNLVTWGPIVVFAIYYINKSLIPLNREILKYIAIFFCPFNSFINPFLYCICKRNFGIYLRKKLIDIKIHKNRKASLTNIKQSASRSVTHN